MRKTLALDANVLVLFAVGLADPRFIARHKRLHPKYRREHFDVLLDYAKRAPALATTTHALTEASNLARYCSEPMRSEIMCAFAELVRISDELTPSAREASATTEFPRLGLTDAAFTLLDPKRFLVLSADLDLTVALQMRGFEAINFDTLLFDV